MKDKLYLLRPGFHNASGAALYCTDSAPVEGVLSFFPQLRELLEVHYLEFPRPRAALVEALGEEHQSLPVLIVAGNRAFKAEVPTPMSANGSRFFADEASIRRYLSTQYGLPQPS
jgi:hypothetical protein